MTRSIKKKLSESEGEGFQEDIELSGSVKDIPDGSIFYLTSNAAIRPPDVREYFQKYIDGSASEFDSLKTAWVSWIRSMNLGTDGNGKLSDTYGFEDHMHDLMMKS